MYQDAGILTSVPNVTRSSKTSSMPLVTVVFHVFSAPLLSSLSSCVLQEVSIKLPSSVFASEFEEDVGLLNKAAPVSGEQTRCPLYAVSGFRPKLSFCFNVARFSHVFYVLLVLCFLTKRP